MKNYAIVEEFPAEQPGGAVQRLIPQGAAE